MLPSKKLWRLTGEKKSLPMGFTYEKVSDIV